MGYVGFVWGLGGVLALLLFAVARLTPMALELSGLPLSALHWVLLITSMAYMAYAEGYKGFHKSFAPRLVVRARYLLDNATLVTTLLAPLFCMGFIYATRKRMILSISLTSMVVVFVILVRMLPQPWRGIVDAGVVVGLTIGVLSILYFLLQSITRPGSLTISPDVPGVTPSGQ